MIQKIRLFFMRLFARKPEKPFLYEIDLNKKYILAFDDFIPAEVFERIKSDINHWAKSDNPILLIRGAGDRGVRLIKLEK